MMFFVWLGIAFFAGIALYIVMPWTAARIAGDGWVDAVAQKYVWLAQASVRKSAIVERDGVLDLVPKRYDADLQGDKDKHHGDPRHHQDGFDVLSRMSNKSFGFATAARSEYISPLLAELGEKFWRAREEGEIGQVDTVGGDKCMKDGVIVSDRSQMVDLGEARRLTTGSSDPETGHESYVKTKISQEKFNQKLSTGQTVMITASLIGSFAAIYLLMGWGDGGSSATETADNTTTLSLIGMLASTFGLTSWDFEAGGRKLFAGIWALAWILLVPVWAFLLLSPVMAILITFLTYSIAIAIPGLIALLGPSIPKVVGIILARGHWILAQLTVGRGCIVRRQTGEYEFSELHTAPSDLEEQQELFDDVEDESDLYDYYVELVDGKRLGIDGNEGDLYRFAWAPLGVTEEKGKHNMGPITDQPPTDIVADGGTRSQIKTTNDRQGYHALLPVAGEGEWLVAGPQLYSWCRETGESGMVEQGRDTALRDHGGEQQMGAKWFMLSVLLAGVIGSGMGILAAGGI